MTTPHVIWVFLLQSQNLCFLGDTLFESIRNPSLVESLTRSLQISPNCFSQLSLLNLSGNFFFQLDSQPTMTHLLCKLKRTGYDCPKKDAVLLLRELKKAQNLRILFLCGKLKHTETKDVISFVQRDNSQDPCVRFTEFVRELSDDDIIQLTFKSFPKLAELHLRSNKNTLMRLQSARDYVV